MRKTIFPYSFPVLIASLFFLLSCKNEFDPPVDNSIKDQSFVEEFDTMQSAINRGWRFINSSSPAGNFDWQQSPGSSADMVAFSSKNNDSKACAYTNYLSTSGSDNGIISNWLVSPAVLMQNGDKIVFYTKSQRDLNYGTDWGCRLQLCVNKKDTLTDIGNGDDAGKFSEVLVDINPTEVENKMTQPNPEAFPGGWTRFEGTISGLSAPTKGKFAFRYFLHNAGDAGAGYGVGIDSVAYVGKK